MFGENIDPTPFIASTYVLGTVLIGGFALLQLRLRQKLRMLEAALKESQS